MDGIFGTVTSQLHDTSHTVEVDEIRAVGQNKKGQTNSPRWDSGMELSLQIYTLSNISEAVKNYKNMPQFISASVH